MGGVCADSSTCLVSAHALHVGFQLTVTVIVYPVLASTPTDRWSQAHRDHTRRITPVVGVVYLLLAAASVVALLQVLGLLAAPAAVGSDPLATGLLLLALLGAGGAALATALGAARTHGRLAQGRDQALVDTLLRQDRVRLGFAVLGATGAVGLAIVLGG